MTTSINAVPHGGSWRLARATAPLTRVAAGRRLFPLWAVVHHRGRRSGRELAVPVAVMHTPDAFVVVLPWGPGTNWVRNVLAAGGATVTWTGREHPVDEPRLLDRAGARPYFARSTWWAVEHLFGAESFLLLHRA